MLLFEHKELSSPFIPLEGLKLFLSSFCLTLLASVGD
jgi:hypothetical protein